MCLWQAEGLRLRKQIFDDTYISAFLKYNIALELITDMTILTQGLSLFFCRASIHFWPFYFISEPGCRSPITMWPSAHCKHLLTHTSHCNSEVNSPQMEIILALEWILTGCCCKRWQTKSETQWPEGHTPSHLLVLHIPDMKPGPHGESNMPEVISQHQEITNRERKNNTISIHLTPLAFPISPLYEQIGFVWWWTRMKRKTEPLPTHTHANTWVHTPAPSQQSD